MKAGISIWAFPDTWSLAQIFKSAKKAGFDGVEVALSEDGEINLQSEKEDMYKIKSLADQEGITLYSVATGLYWQYPLTSSDPDTCEKAKKIVKKQLQVAAWLGCDTILVLPGSVEGSKTEPVLDYDIAFERTLAVLNELKLDAEKVRVGIGLENVWNKFLLSPLEMRDLIDQIDSPYVGAYFDVGNVLQTGYPEHWIKILGNRIMKIHIKDFLNSVGNINGFVDLLSGDVNFPAVMRGLREVGYDGWITAETGFSADYPEQSTINTAGAVRQIIKG